MTGKTRMANTFVKLREQNRAGLIAFVTGGYPDTNQTHDILLTLTESGCDIIELGIPFSDPMADGSVIQQSSRQAIEAGTTLGYILEQVKSVRDKGMRTPIVLMGYYNPIMNYGEERFCQECADIGVDGLIVVDTPPEEDAIIREPAHAKGLAFVRLATPTSDESRLKLICSEADGYLYYVSVAGITGTKLAAIPDLGKAAKNLRQITDLPIAAGFGIRSPEQVRAISKDFDAVICGSALLREIAADSGPSWHKTARFVQGMVKATERY